MYLMLAVEKGGKKFPVERPASAKAQKQQSTLLITSSVCWYSGDVKDKQVKKLRSLNIALRVMGTSDRYLRWD